MPLFAALAPTQLPQIPVGKLEALWMRIGIRGQIAIAALVAIVLIWLIHRIWVRLGRAGRRGLIVGAIGFLALSFAIFATWTLKLPPPKGSVFILWHQIVRIGAVLSGTSLLISGMLLLLPRVLNLIEGKGFLSFVAARHVRAHKSGFLTVISTLSIGGVALSCASLCAVTSIMGGFGADLKRKILGSNAHIRIENGQIGGFERWQEALQSAGRVPGVTGITPLASGEVMISSTSNTAGVLLKGIEPKSIAGVIDLLNNLEVGQFRYIEEPKLLAELPPTEIVGIGPRGELYPKGIDYRSRFRGPDAPPEPVEVYPGIIVGRELAKSLHVYVGDEVTLVSPLGDLGPMGLLPRTQRFRVAAIFFSGMYEYDATHAYIKLDVAQHFLDLGERVTAIEVRVVDAEAVRPVRDAVARAVGRDDVKIRDWKELNRNLFNALLLEKITTFIILSIAITVASFCIICTLLLMVTEKSKEIAILKSLGAADQDIMRLFMLEGIIIGSI
ncbi:MAG TPA: ABC transporter permease, partial [Polyangiaceae bacterium]|nr:ABC transporter permease [Polyangiaceae bacterium]